MPGMLRQDTWEKKKQKTFALPQKLHSEGHSHCPLAQQSFNL